MSLCLNKFPNSIVLDGFINETLSNYPSLLLTFNGLFGHALQQS